MKITVSYLSKINDLENTLRMIEKTSADGIHLDLMDGSYVGEKNFEANLPNYFSNLTKSRDAHLMVNNPENYLNLLTKLKIDLVFFHPHTTNDPLQFIKELQKNGQRVGIAINPEDDIKDFRKYLPFVEAVLIMSVHPGKGGQKFLRESLVNYELFKEEKKNYNFLLYVDGGINDENISYIKEADGVVVGSFICDARDYETQIQTLKNALE